MDVEQNLQQVRERIAEAARRAGRDPREVMLLPVTKTVSAQTARRVYDCGIKRLGENRVQEILDKYPQLPPDTRWHMIGHLQTNKVKYIIDKIALLHSLDRMSLAEEISKRAVQQGITVPALVEVNVSGEESKFGLSPREVVEFIKTVSSLPGLAVRGLMTMAPYVADPEEVRPVFRSLKVLAGEIGREVSGANMEFLSMGMTNDFTIAVEEGANIVRVGTAIFRARNY